MKKFRVWFRRMVTWDADEYVEAEDESAALAKVRKDCLEDGTICLEWFDDDESIEIVGVEECTD